MPTHPIERHFGQAVRLHRQRLGWSQEQLAAQAQLNRSYLGEVERASVAASLATAAKLAQALGVPLAALLAQADASNASDSAAGLNFPLAGSSAPAASPSVCL